MNPEILDKVLSCDRLPSMPAVAMRVIELTNSNRTSMKEIAEVIANDQGLSQKVLRTVNSSFYGLSKPCTTINQAMVMLGLNAVKMLALGFSLVSTIKSRGGGFDYQAYWRRGLLSAVAAKCVAAETRIGHDEEAFLAGLLQDVGMVAMFEALGSDYVDILQRIGDDHRALTRAEQAEFEMTHAEVGGLLAAKWKLPPELAVPIRFHERPTAAPGDYLDVTRALGLGNLAADVLVAPEPSIVLKRYYEKAKEWLSLSNQQADAIMNKVSVGAKDMAKLLEVDLAKFNNPEAVRQKANEALLAISVPFANGGASGTEAPAGETPADANVDQVTLLPGRFIWNQNAVAVIEQFLAGGGPYSLAIAGIDNFADLELQHGAEYTDELSRTLATAVRTELAKFNGMAFNYERGVFTALMLGVDRLTATKVIEKIKSDIARQTWTVKPSGLLAVNLGVTMSAGLVTLDNTTRDRFNSLEPVMETMTRALASAHKAGANVLRVFVPKSAAA
jgi:two-component system, cell cycle response regulator